MMTELQENTDTHIDVRYVEDVVAFEACMYDVPTGDVCASAYGVSPMIAMINLDMVVKQDNYG